MSRSASPGREALASDHPGLVVATGRLRRVLWVWSGLLCGMALLAWVTLGSSHPMAAVTWLVIGVVILIDRQPAFLALVATQWGLSLSSVVPGFAASFGGDPVSISLGATLPEVIGLAVVRLILMVTAWNQFTFYRMLYGTARATGLDPDLPVIPEVIRNRSDLWGQISRYVAFAACVLLILSLAVRTLAPTVPWLSIVLCLATLSVGLGLGSAFSPTHRRGTALTGIGFGLAAYLGALAAGAYFASGRGG